MGRVKVREGISGLFRSDFTMVPPDEITIERGREGGLLLLTRFSLLETFRTWRTGKLIMSRSETKREGGGEGWSVFPVIIILLKRAESYTSMVLLLEHLLNYNQENKYFKLPPPSPPPPSDWPSLYLLLISIT